MYIAKIKNSVIVNPFLYLRQILQQVFYEAIFSFNQQLGVSFFYLASRQVILFLNAVLTTLSDVISRNFFLV